MKVTDLQENECIHCETEEQANAICKLMHEAGLKWRFGGSYLVNKRNYHNICYYPKSGEHGSLKYARERTNKIYKAEQFLTQKQETMSTIVNINPDTSEINITPKEGFEIDLEKSDLKNGKVLLKEVEKKYPDRFIIPKKINIEEVILSEIYAHKLDTQTFFFAFETSTIELMDLKKVLDSEKIIGVLKITIINQIQIIGKDEIG